MQAPAAALISEHIRAVCTLSLVIYASFCNSPHLWAYPRCVLVIPHHPCKLLQQPSSLSISALCARYPSSSMQAPAATLISEHIRAVCTLSLIIHASFCSNPHLWASALSVRFNINLMSLAMICRGLALCGAFRVVGTEATLYCGHKGTGSWCSHGTDAHDTLAVHTRVLQWRNICAGSGKIRIYFEISLNIYSTYSNIKTTLWSTWF